MNANLLIFIIPQVDIRTGFRDKLDAKIGKTGLVVKRSRLRAKVII